MLTTRSTTTTLEMMALVCAIVFAALCIAVPTQGLQCYTDDCCQEAGLQWCSVRGIFQHCITPDQPACDEITTLSQKSSTMFTSMKKQIAEKKQHAALVTQVQQHSRQFNRCLAGCTGVMSYCVPDCNGDQACMDFCEADYDGCIAECSQ